jgi:hypothetical protein
MIAEGQAKEVPVMALAAVGAAMATARQAGMAPTVLFMWNGDMADFPERILMIGLTFP